VRKQLDCRSVNYVSVNKDSHVLEVPEAACGSVPPVLLLVGQKKGFKRYSSEELKELVAARQAREEEREAVESGVLQVGCLLVHRVGLGGVVVVLLKAAAEQSRVAPATRQQQQRGVLGMVVEVVMVVG
jgi:DNA mismatch repair protein MSH6